MVQLLDQNLSRTGRKTASVNDGLKQQLARGADPWFDYDKRAQLKSVKSSVVNTTHKPKKRAKSEGTYPFRALSRADLGRHSSSFDIIPYQVRYSLTKPREYAVSISLVRERKVGVQRDLWYDTSVKEDICVPDFSRYSARKSIGLAINDSPNPSAPLPSSLSKRCLSNFASDSPRPSPAVSSYFQVPPPPARDDPLGLPFSLMVARDDRCRVQEEGVKLTDFPSSGPIRIIRGQAESAFY